MAGVPPSEREFLRVLVVNDDGISAPGLAALLRALMVHYPTWGTDTTTATTTRYTKPLMVRVCAPESEQSAVSHAVTIRNHIYAEPVELPGVLSVLKSYKVAGTPADCVRIAMSTPIFAELEPGVVPPSGSSTVTIGSGMANDAADAPPALLHRPLFVPDLVLSGINRGNNAGLNVIYSGTIAGAREGVILGVPSMALSLDHPPGYPSPTDTWDYDMAAEAILPVVDNMIGSVCKGEVPRGVFFSVNIPNVEHVSAIKGTRLTRQGYGTKWTEKYTEVVGSHGARRVFALTGLPVSVDDVSHDGGAMTRGYISVTPLTLLSNVHVDLPFVKDTVTAWSSFGGR
eukprot:TRINITY_DN10472_c0_g1_i4.p1 TRINITY_DN10472_c0_g1~~TRINITY_DN10472_c0_g1_i4.p1  ORF type:complete len:343 (+),score=81.54 TRINITY_DN10472_c0_g1_i4:33-1061(+)